MAEAYRVEGIYEDDFGCEERGADWEPQVFVRLRSCDGAEITLRQADAWLYAQEINEGDLVTLADGRLIKKQ